MATSRRASVYSRSAASGRLVETWKFSTSIISPAISRLALPVEFVLYPTLDSRADRVSPLREMILENQKMRQQRSARIHFLLHFRHQAMPDVATLCTAAKAGAPW